MHPACSSARDQGNVMLFVKARLELDQTATCLWFSRASMSASTMGEFSPTRYKICLIAKTCGSLAAVLHEVHHWHETIVGVVQEHVLPTQELQTRLRFFHEGVRYGR